MPNPQHFNINGQLLSNNPQHHVWNNLGYWAKDNDYGAACQALARLHGQAAQLHAGEHILELACGYGAAFELWQKEFNINKISALEYRPQCVDYIKQQSLAQLVQISQGRFYPLPKQLNDVEYDAVVCVDAAYHAQSLTQFLAVIASALKTEGRFAFSTLMLADDYTNYALTQRMFAQALLRLANINKANVLSHAQIIQAAQQQQLTDIQIVPLNSVFAGFAQWIEQRASQLPQYLKLSKDWQKIYLTARWCKWLVNYPLLRYVLVSGKKSPLPLGEG